jgi:23S rRNA pseudouridine1911/1915/1917 synthase
MTNNSKAPYEIVYEDEDIIVVYKKRDVFSIRTDDKKTFSHNLYHYLRGYLQKKKENIFIVHRLDYETSGVMVFAKKPEIKEKLQGCFIDHTVGRYYEAVVKEKIELGQEYHVDQWVKEEGNHVVVGTKEDGKEALTDIKANNYIQIGTALAIGIGTGRHNQIRLAIHSLGYTLIGDKRYSHDEAKRMYLNEYKLVFPAESGLKQLTFETEPLWLTK